MWTVDSKLIVNLQCELCEYPELFITIQFFFWSRVENYRYDGFRPRCAKCEQKTASDFY